MFDRNKIIRESKSPMSEAGLLILAKWDIIKEYYVNFN